MNASNNEKVIIKEKLSNKIDNLNSRYCKKIKIFNKLLNLIGIEMDIIKIKQLKNQRKKCRISK